MEKHGAELLLQRMLGNTTATFREGQWEAIDAVVNQRRKLLVVQRTGWGKVPCTSSPVKSSGSRRWPDNYHLSFACPDA